LQGICYNKNPVILLGGYEKMKNNNVVVMCNNNYSFEGLETGRAWELEIIDNNNLLTDSITEQLKDFNKTIYFNNNTGKHWIFDFPLDGVCFESVKIDCNNMKIVLNAYN
jgi:hypothetical protein